MKRGVCVFREIICMSKTAILCGWLFRLAWRETSAVCALAGSCGSSCVCARVRLCGGAGVCAGGRACMSECVRAWLCACMAAWLHAFVRACMRARARTRACIIFFLCWQPPQRFADIESLPFSPGSFSSSPRGLTAARKLSLRSPLTPRSHFSIRRPDSRPYLASSAPELAHLLVKLRDDLDRQLGEHLPQGDTAMRPDTSPNFPQATTNARGILRSAGSTQRPRGAWLAQVGRKTADRHYH